MPAKDKLPRIAVIGAGPIGIEAALYARQLGHPTTVYETGRIGEYFHWWGHVRMFSPFGMNSTPLGRAAILQENRKHEFPPADSCITGKEHLACYLEPLAKTPLLQPCLKLDHRVQYAGRSGHLKNDTPGSPARSKTPFRLLIQEAKKNEQMAEADIILDCSGTYSQPRWLGDGGIPAQGEIGVQKRIGYHLENIVGERKSHYAGKNVMVIGSGYSAAATVSQLADIANQNPETWVVWLARSTASQPIHRVEDDPLKERDRLAVRANTLATRSDANVEFHPGTFVERIESILNDQAFRVHARCAGKPRTWEVERIIANVGYTPDRSIYRELQIHECYASFGPMKLAACLLSQAGSDCLAQTSHGRDSLKNPEPGYYILGTKSYGRNSNFLLRAGFEQIRDVFQLIRGDPDLDLYRLKNQGQNI